MRLVNAVQGPPCPRTPSTTAWTGARGGARQGFRRLYKCQTLYCIMRAQAVISTCVLLWCLGPVVAINTCPSGSYSTESSPTCTQCPAGSYNQLSGVYFPLEIVTSYRYLYVYSNGYGPIYKRVGTSIHLFPDSNGCWKCLNDHYDQYSNCLKLINSNGLQEFLNYIAGTQYPCYACPDTFYSNAGASACTPCQSPLSSAERAASCSPCSPGTYIDSTNRICKSCPAGQYRAAAPAYWGPYSFTENGHTQTDGGYTTYPTGYAIYTGYGPLYYVSGAWHYGNDGYWNTNNWWGNANIDNADLYRATGVTITFSCPPCPAGTWGTLTGQTSQAASCSNTCPAGMYGTATGATSQAQTCQSCSAGTYSSTSAASTCTSCFTGLYANATGLTLCTQCPHGTFADTASAASLCIQCPSGSFSMAAGTTSCIPCTQGTYTSTTSQTTCLFCATGTFVNTTNTTACTPCPSGTYAHLTGATACAPCPNGTGSYPGSSACVSCV